MVELLKTIAIKLDVIIGLLTELNNRQKNATIYVAKSDDDNSWREQDKEGY